MTSEMDERAQFRSALHKGQGRALQAVRAAGRLADEDAVLDACLHNRVYDPQVEGSRVPWLMEILDAAGAAQAFEARIFDAMARTGDHWNAVQFCAFAEAYGRRGSQAARSALYRLFETSPVPKVPEMGDEQIVRLDGIDGLLFVAERYGAARRRGEEREIYSFAVSADEILGVEVVADTLADAALGNRDIRVFNEALAESKKDVDRRKLVDATRNERLKAISAQQLLEAIDDRSIDRSLLTGWGRNASEDELRAAAGRLALQDEPAKLCDYLRIFWRRPLPEFSPRLIELLDHPDEAVRLNARNALSQNSHPLVRDLVLRKLNAGRLDGNTARLLIHNYEAGDELLIEKALSPDDGDAYQLHGLCFSLVDVFQENSAADCAGVMRFVYERTPCSACRFDAVKLLLAAGVAAPALIKECRYDANIDIRDLVAGL